VFVIRARESSGALALAECIFNLEYTGFHAGSASIFTGFHIHTGGAGAVAIDSSGSGSLSNKGANTLSNSNFAAETAAINGLFDNPGNYYINVHRTNSGAGSRAINCGTPTASSFR
jgi:hypothetical protein